MTHKIIHGVKGVAFVAVFYAAVVWLLQPASGGTITMALTDSTQGQSVALFGTGSQDWAVWGAYEESSLTATLGKYFVPSPVGSHPINYTLTNYSNGNPIRGLSQFQVSELFTVAPGQTTYAGIQHDGQASPPFVFRVGEGFALQVAPLTEESVLELYFGVHNGTARLSATGNNYSELVAYTPPQSGPSQTNLYKASFTITGTDAFSVAVVLDEEVDPSFRSGNVFVSAASLMVAAVPEPSTVALLVPCAAILPLLKRRRRMSMAGIN